MTIERKEEIQAEILESVIAVKPYAIALDTTIKGEKLRHLSVVWEGIQEAFNNKPKAVLDLSCGGCILKALKQAKNYIKFELGDDEKPNRDNKPKEVLTWGTDTHLPGEAQTTEAPEESIPDELIKKYREKFIEPQDFATEGRIIDEEQSENDLLSLEEAKVIYKEKFGRKPRKDMKDETIFEKIK